jgi:DNA repair photolyase
MPTVTHDVTTEEAVLACLKSVPRRRWSSRKIETWIKEHYGIGRTHNTIMKTVKFLRDKGPMNGYRIPYAEQTEDADGKFFELWLEDGPAPIVERPLEVILEDDWDNLMWEEKARYCEHYRDTYPPAHRERIAIQTQIDECRAMALIEPTGKGAPTASIGKRNLMRTIYEPKGRAKEYSLLALNLHTGCDHGCRYCYNRCSAWVDLVSFENPKPRPGLIDALEKAVVKYRGNTSDVLLCFTCDPFPRDEACRRVTAEALSVLERGGMNVQLLTKGGTRACSSFPIIKRNNWKFATTLCFIDDNKRQYWEPYAAPVEDRIEALVEAHRQGIATWVSIEPVILPEQALAVIERLRPYVDFWKVGKMNHFPEVEKGINWKAFLAAARSALDGTQYLIKRDLSVAAGELLAQV